jgi:hypothetical protein
VSYHPSRVGLRRSAPVPYYKAWITFPYVIFQPCSGLAVGSYTGQPWPQKHRSGMKMRRGKGLLSSCSVQKLLRMSIGTPANGIERLPRSP